MCFWYYRRNCHHQELYSKIRDTDRVLGQKTYTAILLASALEPGRESMSYATQFPVRLGKQIKFHLVSLSVCVFVWSKQFIQQHACYQASRFEVCHSYAIGTLSNVRYVWHMPARYIFLACLLLLVLCHMCHDSVWKRFLQY